MSSGGDRREERGALVSWSIALLPLLLITAAQAAVTQTETVSISTNGVTIVPGDGKSLSAAGHTYTFAPLLGEDRLSDWYTGDELLQDGRHTSLHGVSLVLDGTTLFFSWHAPTPYDPRTGAPWTPPLHTMVLQPISNCYGAVCIGTQFQDYPP